MIPSYESDFHKVEAIQYLSESQRQDLCGWSATSIIEMLQVPFSPLRLTTPFQYVSYISGKMELQNIEVVNRGDWLLKDAWGRMFVISDASFRDHYRRDVKEAKFLDNQFHACRINDATVTVCNDSTDPQVLARYLNGKIINPVGLRTIAIEFKDSENELCHVNYGDYVVEQDGIFSVFTKVEFEAMFEAV